MTTAEVEKVGSEHVEKRKRKDAQTPRELVFGDQKASEMNTVEFDSAIQYLSESDMSPAERAKHFSRFQEELYDRRDALLRASRSEAQKLADARRTLGSSGEGEAGAEEGVLQDQYEEVLARLEKVGGMLEDSEKVKWGEQRETEENEDLKKRLHQRLDIVASEMNRLSGILANRREDGLDEIISERGLSQLRTAFLGLQDILGEHGEVSTEKLDAFLKGLNHGLSEFGNGERRGQMRETVDSLRSVGMTLTSLQDNLQELRSALATYDNDRKAKRYEETTQEISRIIDGNIEPVLRGLGGKIASLREYPGSGY